MVVDGRLLDDVLEAVGSGKGDPALYTGLLHLLSFLLRLARMASGHLQALLSAKRD